MSLNKPLLSASDIEVTSGYGTPGFKKQRSLTSLICGILFPLAMLLFTMGYFMIVLLDRYHYNDPISNQSGAGGVANAAGAATRMLPFGQQQQSSGTALNTASGASGHGKKDKKRKKTSSSSLAGSKRGGFGKASPGDTTSRQDQFNKGASENVLEMYCDGESALSELTFTPSEYIIVQRPENATTDIQEAWARLKYFGDGYVLTSQPVSMAQAHFFTTPASFDQTHRPIVGGGGGSGAEATPGDQTEKVRDIYFKLDEDLVLPVIYLRSVSQDKAFLKFAKACMPPRALKKALDKFEDDKRPKKSSAGNWSLVPYIARSSTSSSGSKAAAAGGIAEKEPPAASTESDASSGAARSSLEVVLFVEFDYNLKPTAGESKSTGGSKKTSEDERLRSFYSMRTFTYSCELVGSDETSTKTTAAAMASKKNSSSSSITTHASSSSSS